MCMCNSDAVMEKDFNVGKDLRDHLISLPAWIPHHFMDKNTSSG